MKILVTGGAGYIGSHTLIEILENSDYEVISIDNFCNSYPETFDRIENITGKRVVNYNFDLANTEKTRAFFQEHQDLDGIIHFAALKAVGESMSKPLLYYQNNLNSLINLLDNCQEFGIKRFIFSSSSTVYGQLEELPAHEGLPLNKLASTYGYTKYFGEQILQQTATSIPGFSCIALRYFNPVGAHQTGQNGEIPQGRPENLLPIITQTAIGIRDGFFVHGSDYETRDGTCIRDYVHVSDIANAHLLALNHLIEAGEQSPTFDVFNLGLGEGVSVLEIIKAFEKESGQQLPYTLGPRRAGDIPAIYSDCSKVKETLGWQPRFGLEDMINSAWKWEQYLRDAVKWDYGN